MEVIMNNPMSSFTRRLLECRKRYNRHCLAYVLEAAAVLEESRRAVKANRRWLQWLDDEAGMARSTAQKYLRVAACIRRNVSLRRHFERLSIAKVYALSRLRSASAARWARDPRIQAMSDVAFSRFIRPHLPACRRPHAVNLMRSLMAGLGRASRVVSLLRTSAEPLSVEEHRRVASVLASLMHRVRQLKGRAVVA
jgi:hypothetical protein